ncbi:MAG: hypothetical protein ACI8XB_000510 [Patiriisocius sp.]|jgi:hypothetical protein
MAKSLLFLPDISGFTEFVQSTEAAHSQHVISELLEVLIAANSLDLKLAEVEGDALFFYKEEEIPTQEEILNQMESMFTAFFSHLKLLKTNRVCPCNACATAPDLQLKIIAHCGELQFISVQNNRKPFGSQVIEAHRLMKNSVESDNYVLLSDQLNSEIDLKDKYSNHLYNFVAGQNNYDGNDIHYLYSKIDNNNLRLLPFSQAKKVEFPSQPNVYLKKDFPLSADTLIEYITNYSYRHHWAEGVDKFEFDENIVTREGTEHICVINGKQLHFTAVTKDGKADQIVYGEMTTSVPIADEVYQFYIISPTSNNSCLLEVELYWKAKSPLKKIILATLAKGIFKKNFKKTIDSLFNYIITVTGNNIS